MKIGTTRMEKVGKKSGDCNFRVMSKRQVGNVTRWNVVARITNCFIIAQNQRVVNTYLFFCRRRLWKVVMMFPWEFICRLMCYLNFSKIIESIRFLRQTNFEFVISNFRSMKIDGYAYIADENGWNNVNHDITFSITYLHVGGINERPWEINDHAPTRNDVNGSTDLRVIFRIFVNLTPFWRYGCGFD